MENLEKQFILAYTFRLEKVGSTGRLGEDKAFMVEKWLV